MFHNSSFPDDVVVFATEIAIQSLFVANGAYVEAVLDTSSKSQIARNSIDVEKRYVK